MSGHDEQTAQASSASAAPPEADLKVLLTLAEAMATEAASLGGLLGRLALSELRLTARNVPRAGLCGLAMIPLGILSWLGVVVLLSWLIFAATSNVTLALLGFALLNATAMGLMFLHVRTLLHDASMPATRRQCQQILASFKQDEPLTGPSRL